ncbi:phage head-tail joining protein [Sphingomonas sp. 3-13AW]|uniref:phage head-tail joining protein n=1 Tax=Sphingomonas sp. 3-13AW TaxID=3050450 RepID=UPI003BB70AD1
MAYQQSDLDRLDAAISSGVRSVTFADGRRTEYQNLDQLLAARKVVATQLSMQETAKGAVVRRRVPYYRSGL